MKKFLPLNKFAVALLIIFFVADLIGLTVYYKKKIDSEIEGLRKDLQIERIEKEGLENKLDDLSLDLESLKVRIEEIFSASSDFLEEIGQISSTVGTLSKLVQTDKELLQKYSKTYFLNEHYVPTELETIDQEFNYNADGKALQIHASAYPYLKKLLTDAKDFGYRLGVVSAYRSFGSQSVLKSSYKFTYGAGTANQFSAEQGYSEHQLGTTVDFATPETASTFAGFDRTIEFNWLTRNAWRYGFILSYPPNNPYYRYEPWHWRFVGVALSTKLHDLKMNFYDMDQREINTYLSNIFD